MTLADLNDRNAVLRAIDEFDELGRERFLEKHGFGAARKYFLLHRGARYDSKAIVGVAHGLQHPQLRALRAADFSGGETTVAQHLRGLGFEVTTTGFGARSVQYWALCANPKRYRIKEAVNQLDLDHWVTGRSDLRRGDRVFVWQTLDAEGHRGIVAFGEVVGNPETRSDEENPYWVNPADGSEVRARVPVRYSETRNLPMWVDQSTKGEFLKTLNVAKSQGGTCFRVNQEQWARLSVITSDLGLITSEINLRAKKHPIGKLQEIRKELKGLQKIPTQEIFSSATTFEEYAFHHGGRTELQFNVAFENVDGIDELRYGIAFSFEPSQSLPDISILYPKAKLFNDFMELHSEQYANLRMWHYTDTGKRSSDYAPTFISSELAAMKGAFVFLGERQPLDTLEYEPILMVFDRLLPLYRYAESAGTLQPLSSVTLEPFKFRPGCTTKVSSSKISQAQRELDVSFRHNDLQEILYRRLSHKYGSENVGTEIPNGVGTKIDVVVRQVHEFWFYEIKTAHSPRACLRQAISQLLEYAYCPGSKEEPSRIIIVGESALDKESAEYLSTLRKRFSLPIEYEQIVT